MARMTLDEVRDLAETCLQEAGADAANAAAVARTIVKAERDGAHSHGLFRLPGYMRTLRTGIFFFIIALNFTQASLKRILCIRQCLLPHFVCSIDNRLRQIRARLLLTHTLRQRLPPLIQRSIDCRY